MDPVFYTDQQKQAYAIALLSTPPDKTLQVGIGIFGSVTTALRAEQELKGSDEIKQIQQQLKEERGETFFLPTKADAAVLAWQMANDTNASVKDRTAALKEYAAIMGYIEKTPAVNISNNTTNEAPKVMIVKDHGSDDDWEARAIAQQRNLITDAKQRTN